MNLQVSAQAQERLLTKLSSMGLPRSAATALLERHMLVRYPKGAELFYDGLARRRNFRRAHRPRQSS